LVSKYLHFGIKIPALWCQNTNISAFKIPAFWSQNTCILTFDNFRGKMPAVWHFCQKDYMYLQRGVLITPLKTWRATFKQMDPGIVIMCNHL
jgi:hypothetical protein